MLRVIKTDFEFSDDRGTITQLIHDGYKQINVITSKKRRLSRRTLPQGEQRGVLRRFWGGEVGCQWADARL